VLTFADAGDEENVAQRLPDLVAADDKLDSVEAARSKLDEFSNEVGDLRESHGLPRSCK
jgi:hypothetical protein